MHAGPLLEPRTFPDLTPERASHSGAADFVNPNGSVVARTMRIWPR
jgi:hypothetical protein